MTMTRDVIQRLACGFANINERRFIVPVMAVHNFLKIQEKVIAGEVGAGEGKIRAGKKRA